MGELVGLSDANIENLVRFSVVEINALAQHGYEVARKLYRQKNVLGNAQLPDSSPWVPISAAESKALESSNELTGGRTNHPSRHNCLDSCVRPVAGVYRQCLLICLTGQAMSTTVRFPIGYLAPMSLSGRWGC